MNKQVFINASNKMKRSNIIYNTLLKKTIDYPINIIVIFI